MHDPTVDPVLSAASVPMPRPSRPTIAGSNDARQAVSELTSTQLLTRLLKPLRLRREPVVSPCQHVSHATAQFCAPVPVGDLPRFVRLEHLCQNDNMVPLFPSAEAQSLTHRPLLPRVVGPARFVRAERSSSTTCRRQQAHTSQSTIA